MATWKSKPALTFFAAAILVLAVAGGFQVVASGPPSTPGNGYGAIGSDSSLNVSVGSSTGPGGLARFVIVASSTAAPYTMEVFGLGGTPTFIVDNSGNASTTGTLTANSLVGSWSGTISASNISGDVFARLTGSPSSHFAFPNNLGVATGTQVGLPAQLSVYGTGYFSGNVGIGTTAPTGQLSNNSVNYGDFGAGTAAGSFNWLETGGGWNTISSAGTLGLVVATDQTTGTTFQVSSGAYDTGTDQRPNHLFTVLGTGNVGIGTTGPNTKLEVVGNTSSTQFCLSGSCISTWPVGGGGTVTNINSGTGLSGGPITASGTLSIAAGGVTFAMMAQNGCSSSQVPQWNGSSWACGSTGGGGTVTTITMGTGLSSTQSPLTTAGTMSVLYGSTAGTAVQGNQTMTVSGGTGLSGGGSVAVAGGTATLTLDTTHANTWTGIQTFNSAVYIGNVWTYLGSGQAFRDNGANGASFYNSAGTTITNYLSMTGGTSYLANGGGNVGIGTASTDANYELTLSGGGIKADIGSSANPAGYFNNSGAGYSIQVGAGNVSLGSGTVTVGAGGLTLGGVNKTAWPSPGTGTVTNINSGTGLSGGPITASGTLSIAAGGVTFAMMAQNGCSSSQVPQWNGSSWACGSTGGGGTVTTITMGTGLSSTQSPLTTAGTMSVLYGSTAGTAVQGNQTMTVTGGTGLAGGGTIAVAGGTATLTLDLTHGNTWTGVQQFGSGSAFVGGAQGVAIGTQFGFLGEGGTWGMIAYNTGTTANEVDISGATYGLIVKAGNVGFGVTTPGYKLEVASGGATTARFGTAAADTVIIGGGSGKITVGTIDPAYTINGNKFATYGPEMTGVKGETTGNVDFPGTNFAAGKTYSYTLNFAGSAQGSDLWLFGETTQIVKNNLNGLVVMLTPGFDGELWYTKNPAQGTVTIFAKPAASIASLAASYRLTAPRYDASHWSNIGASDAPAGIIIND